MYCTNCGAKLPEDARFCTNCGADLSGTSSDASASAGQGQQGQPATATPPVQVAQPDQPTRRVAAIPSPSQEGYSREARPSQPQRVRRRGRTAAIVAGIAVACVVVVGCAFALEPGLRDSVFGGGEAKEEPQAITTDDATANSDDVGNGEATQDATASTSSDASDSDSSDGSASVTDTSNASESAATTSSDNTSQSPTTSSSASSESSNSVQDSNSSSTSSVTTSDIKAPFWGVWVGAFKNHDNAENTAADLRSKGYYAGVYTSNDWSNLNPETWYVVTAGAYPTQEDANAALPSVQALGYDDAYVKYSGTYN